MAKGMPSDVEAEILGLLVAKKRYGLEMVKASEILKRGTVYVYLSRMEDKGLVRSEVADETGPLAGRRVYEVTGEGQRAYEAWRQAQAVLNDAAWAGGAA
jgi:DNA-binding PadR family transcriptional regulator